MMPYVLLQYIVVPEFWVHNLYVPVADFEGLVSSEELERWIGNDDSNDVFERVKAAPSVHYICMVDNDILANMMPDGVVISKYYMNVRCSC
jgi:hypothetical protein